MDKGAWLATVHGHDLVTKQQYNTVCILSLPPICPLMDTYLCCFHIMTTGSNVAMNTRVRVSFQISFIIFSGHTPGVELLDHMVVLV